MVVQEQAEKRIDVREAIVRARSSLKDVFEDRLLDRLLLEEVELSDDESKWIITFGFDEAIPPERRSPFAPIAASIGNYVRVYKVITVDAFTGEVKSIKIRKV
jgi:hypothetical protein